MKDLLDYVVRAWFAHNPDTWGGTIWVYIAGMVAVAAVIITFASVAGGVTSWFERRVAGRMQSRIGPNRTGPAGFLQWIADALKLMFKEDLIPKDSDRLLFRVSPYLVMTGFSLIFVVLPFGYHLSAADMNVGIFFAVSVSALIVVGQLTSGWSSNSKWSLFGGIRSAAQVISYEIPAGLAILVPILMAGTLSLHGIIRAQGGAPWDWFVFQTPWGFAAFFILFAALLAEGNRTPFDLAEAESELVAGYNTEYSGMRFATYFLVEFGGVWVMSALLATLFLGGWQVPGISPDQLAVWEKADAVPGWYVAVSAAVFFAKAAFLMFVVIWLRWTLPRIRIDQVMALCWKYLVPAGLVLVLLAAATEVLSYQLFGAAALGWAPLTSVRGMLHFAFFAVAGLVPLVLFVRKTFKNIRLTGERVDLSNW